MKNFDELVNWAAGYILQELLKGKFRDAVYITLAKAIEWSQEHNKKVKK